MSLKKHHFEEKRTALYEEENAEEKEFSGLLPNGSADLTMTVSFPRFS